jgi:benzoyl-CoA reductase/2-hydroxyglutaryl-CoA dehydratase subunit BcrC/BadD/HgdB
MDNNIENCCQAGPCASSRADRPGDEELSPLAKTLRSHFDDMIGRCLAYATAAKSTGRPIVGIMCEYTPRELIQAAGGVPVCLCGGELATIATAEEHLPANLCPLIKSTFGYHLKRSNPFLEMADVVIAETTCDGKKKMYELMGQSRDMFVLELPQKAGDADALTHWQAELRKLRDFLAKRYHKPMDDDALRQAAGMTNRYRRLRRKLAELSQLQNPPLTGRQLLDFKSIIWCMESDLALYEQALADFCPQSPRPDLSKRVRVLLTGVPIVHGAEKVVDCIESAGGLVVCMENCTGLKPILRDVDTTSGDILTAIADKYFSIPCSVMTANDARLESLRQLCRQYRPQCIIDLSWQACLTYDVESARVKHLAERELDLPFLRISTDYSPNDAARIALRVEALFEGVHARCRNGGSGQ